MNNSFVFCIRSKENDKDVMDFYMTVKGETLYLFRQKFYQSAYQFYHKKRVFKNAIDYRIAHSDAAIENVIKRIKSYIPYIENEYEIPIRRKAA